MTRFAITGTTGLVGENLVLEILKRHLECLDSISIVCFGRDEDGLPLKERLRRSLHAQGRQYLELGEDDPLLEAAYAALVPVSYDLRRDDLGLAPESRRLLEGEEIDHFFHLAALTDFRHKPHVAERLAEVNERGTERLLRLVASLSIGSFNYVSSAYSCGLTYGPIAPDFVSFDNPFQNPYQRSKLLAEQTVREHFAGRSERLRIFRPSTVSGRLIEQPIGYVNKYDVYLGWMAFFFKCKMDGMPGASWDEIASRSGAVPVRIQTNNDVGLNIVPADFTAKVILSAALTDHDAESYHVVSLRDLPNDVMLTTMLERARVTDWTFTPDPVEPANDYERAYYATVGALYTPYLSIPEPHVFDTTTMLEVCTENDITPIGVDTHEALDLMLDFAIRNRFGFPIDG